MFNVFPIPAFSDNYIWCITEGKFAAVVDPGDADVVEATLQKHHLVLTDILITHHHQDHIGGVERLLNHHQVNIYAPKHEQYTFNHTPVGHQDVVNLAHQNVSLSVIEVPGHTSGHIAYYGQNLLFCGDTLFSVGCGRLFEGTAEQLLTSLKTLAHLSPETLVYCTHEYTQKNIQFALNIEPNNRALLQYSAKVAHLRSAGLPSLPSKIAQELLVNPFLRCNEQDIKNHLAMQNNSELEIFTELRKRRNNF